MGNSITFFLIGDKVKNTMRDREGVFESYESETMALVNYGKGPERTSAKHLELVSKPDAVQLALRAQPAEMELLAQHFLSTNGRIEITCQATQVNAEASKLSQMSSISEINAVDYIKPVSEASHGAKFDIIVSNKLPEELKKFVGTLFKKGLRSGAGEFQINSRTLAEWLMSVKNVLPKKWDVTPPSATVENPGIEGKTLSSASFETPQEAEILDLAVDLD